MAFFLPWKGTKGSKPYQEQKLILPKRTFPMEDACFYNSHTPYFSLPNPSGTVRSFLKALQGEETEEALDYLAAAVSPMADLEQVKKLFEKMKEYHFFSDEVNQEIRTVSLACGNQEGKTEVISLRMVAEPNGFGKWKIYCIEKE